LLRSVTVDANTLQASGTWAQCYKVGNQVFMGTLLVEGVEDLARALRVA
jgi:hypothetical protein